MLAVWAAEQLRSAEDVRGWAGGIVHFVLSESSVSGQVAAATAAAGRRAGIPGAWRLSGGVLQVLSRNVSPVPGLGPFGGMGWRS